eukprot:TRINITY_DN66893_c5_g1_i2.p1 TRINITY_DN66893_c5_g1~~TRINITY_DN66893_c5_g1_i2.p1  ORF type:complete len:128 (-),score=2.56 TRINITY_DN66893_c5_g1_i2:449-832(-)
MSSHLPVTASRYRAREPREDFGQPRDTETTTTTTCMHTELQSVSPTDDDLDPHEWLYRSEELVHTFTCGRIRGLPVPDKWYFRLMQRMGMRIYNIVDKKDVCNIVALQDKEGLFMVLVDGKVVKFFD